MSTTTLIEIEMKSVTGNRSIHGLQRHLLFYLKPLMTECKFCLFSKRTDQLRMQVASQRYNCELERDFWEAGTLMITVVLVDIKQDDSSA